jgi:hypothetical protein
LIVDKEKAMSSKKQWHYESEDGMFGLGGDEPDENDVRTIQSMIDYLRLRYSELNGLRCFDYEKHLAHLTSCEIGDLSHAAFQLTCKKFEPPNWSEGFDELTYRRLLGQVTIVLSRFHQPDLQDRITDNAPHWSKDLLPVIHLCNEYVKARGGAGVDCLLAGAWLNTTGKGSPDRMPGKYDWIVCEPLALPAQ